MSVVFQNLDIPKNCMECEWRDAEACGECELMIGNPFDTFKEQYDHCPFRVISKRHPLVHVPPHGDLVDRDAMMKELEIDDLDDRTGAALLMAVFLEVLKSAPTVIPAEPFNNLSEPCKEGEA